MNNDPVQPQQQPTPVTPSSQPTPATEPVMNESPAPIVPPVEPSDPPAPVPDMTSQSPAALANPFANTAPVSAASAPAGAPMTQPTGEDPGKTMGIIGLVMSLLGFGLISLVISIMAKSQSKKAGFSNGMALAGIIISAITMVLGTLAFVFIVILGKSVVDYCNENGRTVTNPDGTTSYQCGDETTPSSPTTLTPSPSVRQ